MAGEVKFGNHLESSDGCHFEEVNSVHVVTKLLWYVTVLLEYLANISIPGFAHQYHSYLQPYYNH